MDTSTPPSLPGTARGRSRIMAALLASTFMAAAEVTIISTAMPTIVADVGGLQLFTWAFGVYLLCQAVTTPIYGRLADLYGRRAVYLGSLGLFLVGSLLCGLAWSMPSLIAFRALQGLGGGGLVPLATIILSEQSTPEDRPRVFSYVSGMWGIAAIAGPLLGSLCVGTLGWQFVFWLNLPVGAVAAGLVLRHMREPARPRRAGRIDLVGSALLAAGVGAVMAALVQWESLGAGALAGLCGAGAACLALFGLRERGSAEPMLAAHLLRRPVILAANASTLLCGALMIAVTAFLPPLVQGVLGRSSLVAGAVLGVMTVSWTAAAMLLGRVLTRLRRGPVALAGAVLMACGATGLLLASGLPALLASCVPLGAGLGISSLVFTVAVTTAAHAEERGRATSLFYFSRLIGQAVGAAVLGGVLNAGLAAGGAGAQGALRALMNPAGRAALPAGALASLVPVLAGALHGVFATALVVALLTIPVAGLVLRRQSA